MTETLKKIIPQFKGKKVLVLGDLMLDEHLWSLVSRISPEAPVPVADVYKTTHVPGGCGNVAQNIKTLGGTPYLIGLVGNDSSAAKLLSVLKRSGISTSYIVKDNGRPTVLKSRVIAGSQQVVRVDREMRKPISAQIEERMIASIKKAIKEVDAIVISDYAKGVVSNKTAKILIGLAKKAKKPVCVDPKGDDYSKYSQATVITPNLSEAEAVSKTSIKNEKDLASSAKIIFKQARSNYVLITRGKDGMSLFSNSSNLLPVHIPAISREVFDITGAGDTVIAALSLALAAKASIEQAAVLGNYAASVAVTKTGTAPVSARELDDVLEGNRAERKIKPMSAIGAIVDELKKEDYKIVFTNGCFDILHLGHIRYLKEAKKLGDILIVGLNSDASVKKLKGTDRPYVKEAERAEILAAVEYVDYIVVFGETRPDNLISKVKPHIHVKGGDYDPKDLPEAKTVKKFGGKVMVLSKIEGRSTSSLIEKIKGE